MALLKFILKKRLFCMIAYFLLYAGYQNEMIFISVSFLFLLAPKINLNLSVESTNYCQKINISLFILIPKGTQQEHKRSENESRKENCILKLKRHSLCDTVLLLNISTSNKLLKCHL